MEIVLILAALQAAAMFFSRGGTAAQRFHRWAGVGVVATTAGVILLALNPEMAWHTAVALVGYCLLNYGLVWLWELRLTELRNRA